MITRISIGYFERHQAGDVAAVLERSAETLVPALRKLSGLQRYVVGLDKSKGAMTNTSHWDTLEAAEQMASLPEMLALRGEFETLGIRFIEITNHELLWEI